MKHIVPEIHPDNITVWLRDQGEVGCIEAAGIIDQLRASLDNAVNKERLAIRTLLTELVDGDTPMWDAALSAAIDAIDRRTQS
jgi:hypothetical protein